MKHLVPLALAALLLVGCGLRVAPTPGATATPTSSAASTKAPTSTATAPAPTAISAATPLQTVIPLLGWDVPPMTGIAHVDAIVAAVIAGDAPVLERFITGRELPCGRSEPVCPQGTSPGTPVQAFGGGGCPGDGGWTTLVPPSQFNPDPFAGVTTTATVAARLLTNGMRLVGVYEDSGSGEQYWYRIAFRRDASRGVLLYLTDHGISESIGANGDPRHGCLAPWPGDLVVVAPR